MKTINKYITILNLLFLSHVSFSQMSLSYDASSQSCDCYTITPNANNSVGGVFSPNTIDLNNPFNFTFQVNMGSSDASGADGIVFTLQQGQSASNLLGGGELGFQGLSPSIGIEIDTYQNTASPHNDPLDDHVTIISNGDFSSVLTSNATISNIEDGDDHTVNITWNPTTQVFAISIDGNLISSYTGDIINNIFSGNPNVYFGFTGATGGLNNLQTFCMYRNAAFTQNQTNVCIGEAVSFTDNSTSDLGQITYLWDFGDGTTSTLQNPTHTWATSGTKNVTLTISDPSGCTDVANVSITVMPAINATFNVTDVSCNGGNDGAIVTTPTNGTGPYNYSWDIPSTTQSPTNLSAGTYNLTITDNLGCTGTHSVTVNEPPALTITSTSTTPSGCSTGDNGSITVNATGGFGTYQYSVDGNNYQANNLLNGLSSGTYTVYVRDANNCVATISGVVVGSTSVFSLVSVVVTDASCGLDNGTVEITVQNGDPDYFYYLNSSTSIGAILPITTSDTTATFTGLPADAYNVVVSSNGCQITSSASIHNITALAIDNVNTTITNVSCGGGNDGALDIAITGGTPNYQYSIDGGTTFQSSSTFTNLTANTYNVQVIDGASCVVNGSFTITEPAPLVINSVVNNAQVICNGGNDGSVTVNVSGGDGNYTYSLDGGLTTQTSNVFSNLTAGNYTVTLLDGSNCSTSTNGNFTITEPQPISISANAITVTNVSCNGANDGAISIDVTGVTGGTPSYQFSLDGITYQSQPNFTNLGFGTYTVYISDIYTCTPSTNTVNITEAAPLTVNLGSADTTICFGSTVNICANVSGGTPPYTYTWNGIIIPSQCIPIPTNTAGTSQVTVSITDFNGCVTQTPATKNITVLPQISVNVLSNPVNGIVCPGETVQLIAEANGGNNGPYTYTWTNNIDGTVLTGASQIVTSSALTNYTVTVSDGCTLPDATNSLTVDIYPVPSPTITASPNSGCTPLISEFTHDIPATNIVSQQWTFSNGNTSNQTTTTQTFVDEGCTDVNYTMTTNDGCILDTTLVDFVCVYSYPIADFEYTPDSVDLLNTEVSFTNLTTNGDNYLWTFGTGDSTTANQPIFTYPEFGNRDYTVWLFATNNYGCKDSISKNIHIIELPWYYIPNTFTPEGNNRNELFHPVFIPGFTPRNYSFTIFNRWGEVIYQTNDIYGYWDGVYKGVMVPMGTYIWQIKFAENKTDKVYIERGHVNVIH